MRQQEILERAQRVIEQGPYTDTWESLCTHPNPKWYQDAKLGIFIHWGVYSVPAYSSEWYSRYMYVKGTKAYEHHLAVYGPQDRFGYNTTLNLKTFNYPLTTGNAFDHICRQQTYGFT